MSVDLSTLSPAPGWLLFDDRVEEEEADRKEAALAAARAALGDLYTSETLDDETLEVALDVVLAYAEAATRRLLVRRDGTIRLVGRGDSYLDLPAPLVAATQGGDPLEVELRFEDEDADPVDAESYRVVAGVGIRPNDPRDRPRIELRRRASLGFGCSRFDVDVDVFVTGSWGYLDEKGRTPLLARRLAALLVPRALVPLGDEDAVEDLSTRGRLVSEATVGRSYTLAPSAVGGSLTGTRETDALVAHLRAPIGVYVPPRRSP